MGGHGGGRTVRRGRVCVEIGWHRIWEPNKEVSNGSKAIRRKRNLRQRRIRRRIIRETGGGKATEQEQANGRRDRDLVFERERVYGDKD